MPKKLKHKTYRIPENRHYIFIQNPWPFDFSVSTARYPTTYVNAVVAWVCCMVRDLCDTDIDKSNVRIFYQCTHRDIIAEIELASLPSLAPLLGAHHSFKFLTPKHVGDANHTSVVYEYNYERFNSPDRTNWTTQMATYAYLPPDFAIKNEGLGFSYPAPSPSDTKRPQTARSLPGRLILGHPDCPPDTPQDAARQAPAQPTEPVMTATPRLQSEVTEAKTAQSTLGVPTTNECLAPDASLHIPPPPGHNPPSEFAFTPYVPPMHFPRACSGSMPAATPPLPSKSSTKRDPYEEEDNALERLKGTHVAFADAQVKSEVTTEGVLNVHVQRQDMQARNAESTSIKEERGDGDVRFKTEDVKKEVTYSASALLREVYTQGQAEMRVRIAENTRPAEVLVKEEAEEERVRETVRVKTAVGCEPSALLEVSAQGEDTNSRTDWRVKSEIGEMGTLAVIARHSASSPSAFSRPTKQSEFLSRPSSDYSTAPYADRDPCAYNLKEYLNRGSVRQPKNPIFPKPPAPSSNHSLPPNDTLSGRHAGGVLRKRSGMRTFSPASQPRKREPHSYDDQGSANDRSQLQERMWMCPP
ncbi:hypothetical protein DFH06DRAFT_1402773 [Mycena polygramma]|nr:hypothetical protein DFH06DRAFT_1402773 [Mycena polygramma]